MPPALCKGWFYAPMTSTRLPAAACRRRAIRRTQGSPGPPGRHPRPRRQHDRPAAGPTKSPGETRRTGRPDTSAPDPPRPLRQQTGCITIHSVWHRLPCRPNGLARRSAAPRAFSPSCLSLGVMCRSRAPADGLGGGVFPAVPAVARPGQRHQRIMACGLDMPARKRPAPQGRGHRPPDSAGRAGPGCRHLWPCARAGAVASSQQHVPGRGLPWPGCRRAGWCAASRADPVALAGCGSGSFPGARSVTVRGTSPSWQSWPQRALRGEPGVTCWRWLPGGRLTTSGGTRCSRWLPASAPPRTGRVCPRAGYAGNWPSAMARCPPDATGSWQQRSRPVPAAADSPQ